MHITRKLLGLLSLFLFAAVAAHATGLADLGFLFGGSSAMMAAAFVPAVTFLDIAKRRGNDAEIGLIEENLRYSPELQHFFYRPIKGTQYKTLIRTGFPPTGFRLPNEGIAPGKSTWRNETFNTHLFGGAIELDVAATKGAEDPVETLLADEASGVTESATRNLSSQIWYGQARDPKGFPGLKTFAYLGDLTANGDTIVTDAGGTTANEASSVYFLKFGKKDVSLIGGNDSALNLGEWATQQVTDEKGGKFRAFVNDLAAWIGLAVHHQNCYRRIANLTTQAGKGLTDALLYKALETFPEGFKPDLIWMSRRSRSQLQNSRTVVLQGQGRNRPEQPNVAPIPTEFEGIPIQTTDHILNTDAIETLPEPEGEGQGEGGGGQG